MKIEQLQQLIESKEVTTDHFNVFLETLPGSSDERRAHHTRPRQPGRKKNPVTNASTISREGDTAPDTGRRRRAIEKRGRENKQTRNRQQSQKDAVEQFEPDSFSEALEFINTHHTLPIAECINDLNRVSDKDRLSKLVTRLMGTTNHDINRDWLYNIHWNLTDAD